MILETNLLIGKVTANIIRGRLEDVAGNNLSRFLLNRFRPDQLGGICKAVQDCPVLSTIVMVRISKALSDSTVPSAFLTNETAVYWRNYRLPYGAKERALLCATMGDSSAESMDTVSTIDAVTLSVSEEPWIKALDFETLLTRPDCDRLKKAIRGLRAARLNVCNLDAFASYLLSVKQAILDGKPLPLALDSALPELRIASRSADFDGIPEKNRGNKGLWQKRFADANRKTAHLLRKEAADGNILDRQALRGAFEKIKDGLDDAEQGTVSQFIEAEPGWNPQAHAFAQVNWNKVSGLFEDLKKNKAQPLGEQTKDFFAKEYPDLLEDEDLVNYLDGLNKPKNNPDQDDIEFFEEHKDYLKDPKAGKLLASWDKLIYGVPKPYGDFLEGLLASLPRVIDQAAQWEGRKRLRLSLRNAEKLSTWEDKNPDVVGFFAYRYHGLRVALQDLLEFDTGRLFNEFIEKENALAELKGKGAKAACELKFNLALLCDGQPVSETQFIWSAKSEAAMNGFRKDLLALAKAKAMPLLRLLPESVGAKGQFESISVKDCTSFRDAHGGNDGRFIKIEKDNSFAAAFLAALQELRNGHLISDQAADEIQENFNQFIELYHQAIAAWIGGDGISSSKFAEQHDAYGKLLHTLLERASSDKAVEKLWGLAASVGVAFVRGMNGVSVITPWHPMRMMEIHTKAFQLRKMIGDILRAEKNSFAAADLFFADICREISSPYYPQVCPGEASDGLTLVTVQETAWDYSLAMPPIGSPHWNRAKETSIAAASQLAADCLWDAASRYVDLMPHKASSQSIVLYDPSTNSLLDEISNRAERFTGSHADSSCGLYVIHKNKSLLRSLYRKANEGLAATVARISNGADAVPLRVTFLEDLPNGNDASGDTRFADIVFLENAILERAKLKWESAVANSVADAYALVPPRVSRKRPVSRGDTRAVTFLTSPLQTTTGQFYLNLLKGATEGVSSQADVLPAYEISLGDPQIKDLVTNAHKLGTWVVSYDVLSDRRLLRNQGISLIRYRQGIGEGGSTVISTTSSMRLLNTLLRQRVQKLELGLDSNQEAKLIEKMIRDATEISGYILMRAAQHGKFANEMIGVVLSRWLIEAEIQSHQGIGWFFLDDYANWFGQKEGRIADLMILRAHVVDGQPRLTIVISEAKYVDEANREEASKDSARQLQETVQRIDRILGGTIQVDRSLWRSRIADMMIEGVEPFSDLAAHNNWTLEDWAHHVREGDVPIEVRGYSHVFIHNRDEGLDYVRSIPRLDYCQQEVYSRHSIGRFLKGRLAGVHLTDLKAQILNGGQSLELASRLFRSDDESVPSDVTSSASEEQENDSGNVDEGQTDGANQVQDVVNIASPAIPTPEAPVAAPAPTGFWGSGDLYQWVKAHSHLEEDDPKLVAWKEEVVVKLRKALINYGYQAQVIDTRITPNAVLVRFKGSDDLQVKDIEKHRDNLKTTHALDILAVQPELGAITVAVKRPQRAVLSLASLWARRKINRRKDGANLSLLIGAKESDGTLLYLNIGSSFEGMEQHAPHTLVAGTSGSGKSVLIQNLILDIAATNSPSQAVIHLIDPKSGLDYLWAKRLPHLVGRSIITRQEDAITVLNEVTEEMDRRYERFAKVGAENLNHYNGKMAPSDRLPVVWVIHDEFADWMIQDDYRDNVEEAVQRLGVKARAAGIHLIFAAQRPDNTVFPMQLRSNMDNRLVLKVSDAGTSEIALGQKGAGAEFLLGKGHLAARLGNEPGIIFAQVPFLDSEERSELMDILAASEGRADGAGQDG